MTMKILLHKQSHKEDDMVATLRPAAGPLEQTAKSETVYEAGRAEGTQAAGRSAANSGQSRGWMVSGQTRSAASTGRPGSSGTPASEVTTKS